ncbi:tubby protein homolog [Aulostomus maculatus]
MSASPLSVEDLQEFAMRPAPEEEVIRCRITRDRSSFYPVYYLHMERDDGENVFLMAARKRKKCRTSNYVISTDHSNLSRKASGYIGKLRSNLMGTKYTVYDCGENPAKTNCKGSEAVRQELAAVSYERSDHGVGGPRKMKVVIPGILEDDARVSVRPQNEQETLLMRQANDDMDQLITLQSKSPSWDDRIQSFTLDFNKRVTRTSEKNFQLVHPQNEDYVVMQFGRVSEDVFTMDYSFPMCAFQAFAIALSSFDGKLPFGELITSWTKGTQKSIQKEIEDYTDWKNEGTASPSVLSPLSTPRQELTGSEPNLRASSPLFVEDLNELVMCFYLPPW